METQITCVMFFSDISRMGVKALEIMAPQLQDYVLRMLSEFQGKRSLAAKPWPLGPKNICLVRCLPTLYMKEIKKVS